MKKLIFFSCLLFVFPLLSQNVTPATVTTQGTAIVYAAPDDVLLNVSITTKEDKISDARKGNAESAKKVISYFKSKGIAAQHIQTKSARVRPKYKYKVRELSHYEATQTIYVCIKNLRQLDEIVDGYFEMEVGSMNSLNFRTSKLKKHQEQARRKAIIEAQNKAASLAEEIGQKIGKAYQITEEKIYRSNPGAYNDQPAPVDESELDSSFAPGQLQIQATVKAAFYLE